MNKPQQLARTLANSIRTHVIFERDFYITLGAAFGTGLLISIALMILVLLLSNSTYADDGVTPAGGRERQLSLTTGMPGRDTRAPMLNTGAIMKNRR